MVSYDKQTNNTRNPIARFSHRNRLARSISLVTSEPGALRLLDYGCGSGTFINAIQNINGIKAYGYEPFMEERVSDKLPIYKDLNSLEAYGPYEIITIFETIEHFETSEILDFLTQADALLTPNGKILFSAPIEIGPAVLMKELNRCILHKRLPENSPKELVFASFFGVPATRAVNVKVSHKGFDFRKVIRFLENQFGPVTIISYGPLPIGTWYGNSQVYFWLTRR